MSGHSKWSQIKRKKAGTDAAKSKTFGKIGRYITVESKKCRGDVNAPSLRAAIEKGKSMNMPNDTIERAVKKGLGGEAGSMENILYEAYGPGGCGIIIEALTDNRNKAAAEVKHILSKNGSTLAAQGAASWNFEKGAEGWVPKTTVPLGDADAEQLAKIVEELEENDEVQNVYTSAE